ncbi:serine/threonine-protein kinase [Paraliomyxa miuraensis]|uniref:serine/threonine-protein kinase n=1 Tax=Paraliomyxa miuraensis TaxID=376150 RepID=UPI002250BBED|nr:serine/threonine-protein kinase [Paraliomyxa miuraensis]MCX4240966.1 serine/threonine-protein kinase [Paraliomyxa miuraensis]
MTEHEPSSASSIEASSVDVVNAARRDRLRAALFDQAPRPRTVGRFEVQGTLGRGGMGSVLEAIDPMIGRTVAIKLLHPRIAAADRERLRREARILARVAHPNVVQVYEIGEHEGRLFVAMERVPGKTLRQWQAARPGWQECLDAYRQAARGLAAAHAVGVVHRDFKPHNCMRDDSGRVRVLDFGLAHEPGADDDRASGGTVAYMAPEQLAGGPVDARSDQFAFCVSLLEAVGGVHPFAGDRRRGLASASTAGRRAVPSWLTGALRQGLREHPDARWPSMEALLHALAPPQPRTWHVLRAMTASAVGIAGGLWWAAGLPDEPCRGADQRVAQVWNEQRSKRAEAGMLATKLPIASDSWAHTQPWLDAYAGRWAEAHAEICRATYVRGEQSPEQLDLRMTCLGRRLDVLSSLLDSLEHADAEVALASIDAAMRLPDPAVCSSLELDDGSEPPEAAALRRALIAAQTEQRMARLAPALAGFQAVLERAQSSGWTRLVVEAQLGIGMVESDLGHGTRAAEALDLASREAFAAGHDDVALEATLEHAEVLGLLLGAFEPAEASLQRAEALLERLGNPEAARFRHALVASKVLIRHGRLEPATHWLASAAELEMRLYGARHPSRGFVLDAQGQLAIASARHEDAQRAWLETLALDEQLYGPRHPHVASTLNNLAVVAGEQQQWDRAREHLERSLEIRREVLGAHPQVADVLLNLSFPRMHTGELELALEGLAEAHEIYVTHLGIDAPKTLDAEHARGLLLEASGRPNEAEMIYRRVIARRLEVMGDDHPDLRRPLASLGRLLFHSGRPDEAVEPLQRALELERSLVRAGGGDPEASPGLRERLELLEGARAAAAVLEAKSSLR